MEEFNNNFQDIENESNEQIKEQTVETKNAQQPLQEEQKEPFIPPYNPINFTAVTPVIEHKPMSFGLKVFAFIMAVVLVLTTACMAGYFLGKNSASGTYLGNKISVGLDAKPTKTDELTAPQVYEKVNPSIVGIRVYNDSGVGANASGVIYSQDGYIVTNDHIYSEVGAAKFKIYTHDGKEYDAVYVAGDVVSDLAVLKIEKGKFTPAKFGDSEQLIFGENVVAIGRPNGASNPSSITKGIISATNRRVQTTSNYSSRLIQTDSSINPGSSGGALVNMYGQVVGITSSKLASVEYDAVGYAIPTTVMKRIVEELIQKGNVVSRAKLGITYTAIDSVTASISEYKYEGLYVQSVAEDSDLYGKVNAGDVITHINGIKVTSDNIVLDIIEQSKAGDKINVTYINKNGNSKTISAVLRANIGESSYSKNEQPPTASMPNKNDGTFDFPFGE